MTIVEPLRPAASSLGRTDGLLAPMPAPPTPPAPPAPTEALAEPAIDLTVAPSALVEEWVFRIRTLAAEWRATALWLEGAGDERSMHFARAATDRHLRTAPDALGTVTRIREAIDAGDIVRERALGAYVSLQHGVITEATAAARAIDGENARRPARLVVWLQIGMAGSFLHTLLTRIAHNEHADHRNMMSLIATMAAEEALFDMAEDSADPNQRMLHESRRAAHRMADVAVRDHVTGLPNGRRVDTALEEVRARLAPGERAVGISLRIDALAEITEIHGPVVAEATLAHVADRCGELLSPHDRAYRVSTDRLLLVLARPDDERSDDLHTQLTRDLGGVIDAPVPLDPHVHVGVAPATADDTVTTLRLASDGDLVRRHPPADDEPGRPSVR